MTTLRNVLMASLLILLVSGDSWSDTVSRRDRPVERIHIQPPVEENSRVAQLDQNEMEPYAKAFGGYTVEPSRPHYEEGSLWSEASLFNSPFDFEQQSDYVIGDIIVVEFKENFQSRDDLKLENTTESELGFNIANLWSTKLDSQLFGRTNGEIDYPTTGITGNDDFEGESKGKQTSILTHTVACTVRKIMPDGKLLIEGRDSRIIGVDKKIYLMSGVVDPDDVDPEKHTISSSRVADSQFRWEGNGPGQNIMKPGIIHRFLDYVPFF